MSAGRKAAGVALIGIGSYLAVDGFVSYEVDTAGTPFSIPFGTQPQDCIFNCQNIGQQGAAGQWMGWGELLYIVSGILLIVLGFYLLLS